MNLPIKFACLFLYEKLLISRHVGIENEKMLLFSRLNEIRAVYLSKPYYHAASPITLPVIVAPSNLHFVAKNQDIYWSDVQSGEIKRANIKNGSIVTLIDSGIAGYCILIRNRF